jgi:hypothetical protein
MVWSSAHLFAMDEYPAESGRQQVFYGQSASLVRFLIARRGAGVFLRFIDDLDIDGPTIALDRHYDLASPDALDRAWLTAPAGRDVGLD